LISVEKLILLSPAFIAVNYRTHSGKLVLQ